MQSFTRRLSLAFAAVLSLLSLCAAIFLCAAVLSGYDRQLHHFTRPNGFAAAAAVLCVLGALASLAFCLSVRQKKLSAAPVYTTPAVFSSALVGFLLLFSFILNIASAAEWMDRIRLAMMALAAFCFLIPTQRSPSLSAARALLSLAPILFAFLSVLDVYFDTGMGMNAPLKSYSLMMYLSMALFFTAETRVALQRIKTPSYCLFGGLCVILTGAVGGSHIVFALQGFALTLSLQDSILCTVIAVYAALRLFSLRESTESMPTETGEEDA